MLFILQEVNWLGSPGLEVCDFVPSASRGKGSLAIHVLCVVYILLYRMTQKRELLKNPTKIEEIQEKKIIDRN